MGDISRRLLIPLKYVKDILNKLQRVIDIQRKFYIIESEKVKNKCMEVSVADRASDNAVEYKVEDLTENEFEPIFFKDILDGIVEVADKKVGE